MEKILTRSRLANTFWSWPLLDGWLADTKLAPDRRAAVKRIVLQLKRTPESLLELAGSYEKGAGVKVDAKKANQYRLLAHRLRGSSRFRAGEYADALPDLIKVCESADASADDHDTLARCYGKLGRWDDAIASYTRSVELDLKNGKVPGPVPSLLEAMICAERPGRVLPFVQSLEKKGWKLPAEGALSAEYNAFFYGFQAIALRMIGKDSSEPERMMRSLTGKPGYNRPGWSWDEFDGWFKTTKLAADRKAAVEKIVSELKNAGDR
jgi:tetratricopeptide (TPR) repeat protein